MYSDFKSYFSKFSLHVETTQIASSIKVIEEREKLLDFFSFSQALELLLTGSDFCFCQNPKHREGRKINEETETFCLAYRMLQVF